MSWARAAVYWLVAAVLALVYLGPFRHEPAPALPTPTPAGAVQVTEIPLPLRRIELRRGAAVVAWERRPEGGWRVVEPAGRAIPPGLLDAFAEQLAAVSLGEHFDGNAADPAFGLEKPGLRIGAFGEDGRSVVLAIGERSPTGTAAYARREEGGPVLLVGLNLLYYADLLFDAAR